MEIEHAVKMFTLDEGLENNIKTMSGEGWMMVPGIVPVGIYHVVRVKGMQPAAGVPGEVKPVARLSIDDSKVKILRDGQLIDGT